MSWEVGHVIKVTTVQDYLDQTCFNTFHYEISTFGDTAQISTWSGAFITNVIDALCQLQNTEVTYNQIRVEDITDELGLFVGSFVKAGELVGSTLPSYVAGGFIRHVGDRRTRSGSLRIVGLTEGTVADNSWVPNSTALTAALTALESPLNNGETGDDEIEAFPVVWGQLKNSDPVSYVANPIIGFGQKTYVTTQNSRKVFTGI